MTYAIDVTSDITDAYLVIVGAALVLTILWAPAGVVGGLRARWARWLP
jgi:branched-chain amino acid transport system permease protein